MRRGRAYLQEARARCSRINCVISVQSFIFTSRRYVPAVSKAGACIRNPRLSSLTALKLS
uniref:Uncharacterized protein n=1 Tax=Human herpesvirus 2 TaxID=10310 RepID=A0A481TX78_HHV2|nr:hypothetical protein [Human alphaherpesvirus 2]QBH85397.1 hypothetical protein [Human alphaherpesvirus 2]